MGWWAISSAAQPGIDFSKAGTVPGLVNQLPDQEDDSGTLYNGDQPADKVGECLEEISQMLDLRKLDVEDVKDSLLGRWDQQPAGVHTLVQKLHDDLHELYQENWGRDMDPVELEGVINFVLGPYEDERGFDELYEDPRPGDWEPEPLFAERNETCGVVGPSDPVEIPMLTTEYEGMPYGAGACVVSLFGTPMEAVAAFAGEERFICTAEHVTAWLIERGLPEDVTKQLVEDAQQEGQNQDVEKLTDDED